LTQRTDPPRKPEQPLRELVARLQSAREDERTRVARQLHDNVSQALTVLKMNCCWMSDRLAGDPCGVGGGVTGVVTERIKSSMELVDETLDLLRGLSAELRPGILDLGLSAAVEWQSAEFQSRSEIECRVELSGEELLDNDRATQLFRVFQETLSNIARHSAATRANITLRQDRDQVVLEVRDNGTGISEAAIHGPQALGVLGMRERVALLGGTLSIQGDPGCGTSVHVCVPVDRAGEG
jgi:signal transduction histidine kinase